MSLVCGYAHTVFENQPKKSQIHTVESRFQSNDISRHFVFVLICQSSTHSTADFYQNLSRFVNKTRNLARHVVEWDFSVIYKHCALANTIVHPPVPQKDLTQRDIFSSIISFLYLADGSGTIMVRGCALDSGTLTTDTELIRMSHCGSFYFEDKYVDLAVANPCWSSFILSTFALQIRLWMRPKLRWYRSMQYWWENPRNLHFNATHSATATTQTFQLGRNLKKKMKRLLSQRPNYKLSSQSSPFHIVIFLGVVP